MAGLEKHVQIPPPERDRYCSCLSRQATPKLNNQQLGLINEVMADREKNDLSLQILPKLKSSAISNIISPATEYCVQQYWSENYKSTKGTNGFDLSVNCDIDTHTLSIGIDIHNKDYKGYSPPPPEASMKELDSYVDSSRLIQVEYKIDDSSSVKEHWQDNVYETTDDKVFLISSPKPKNLWKKISVAKKMHIKIVDTKNTIFNAQFDFSGQFPNGWQACKPHL